MARKRERDLEANLLVRQSNLRHSERRLAMVQGDSTYSDWEIETAVIAVQECARLVAEAEGILAA